MVVLTDKDRVKSGRYAIEQFGCDTLLLDDGFQYWKLAGRRRDIVLWMPSNRSAMNISCLAARCATEHISRADTIFITKATETAGLRARIRKHTPARHYRVRPLAALFRRRL